MPVFETLTDKGFCNLLKVWSWFLIILLGLLAPLAGCITNNQSVLCYGIIPSESISMTGPKNPFVSPDYNIPKENSSTVQSGK